MSANDRAADEALARDVAMKIFRDEQFDLECIRRPATMRSGIAYALSGRDVDVTSVIVRAFPSMKFGIKGTLSATSLLAMVAAKVVERLIVEIVGTEPRYLAHRQPSFCPVFLGGDRRKLEEHPLAPLQLMHPRDEHTYVDYWGSRDGRTIVVVYGSGQFDYLAATDDDEDAFGRWHVREALRRAALAAGIPIPICPAQRDEGWVTDQASLDEIKHGRDHEMY